RSILNARCRGGCGLDVADMPLEPHGNGEYEMSGFVRDVVRAGEAMRALFPETPLQENDYLSKKTGARIFLKREDLSPVRSYKIRGAFNFFRKALAGGATAQVFVCASAGN